VGAVEIGGQSLAMEGGDYKRRFDSESRHLVRELLRRDLFAIVGVEDNYLRELH
jgi:hypothetical protein